MFIFFKKIAFTLAVLLVFGYIFWQAQIFFPDPLNEESSWNWTVRVTDRHGRPLKDFLPPGAARREFVNLRDFSPTLVQAVLAAEDKRFYHHPGVDPLAMLRAAWLNARNLSIKSGGSTITMQLARLHKGLAPGPRTLGRKIREIWWALLIERHNSKEVILAAYLNSAPCGNLTEGFPAAAQLYLGKSVKDLSYAESAFLAGLPASPGALNPYKDPRPALARRAIILKRMSKLDFLTAAELARASAEPLDLKRHSAPFKAPHFVSHVRGHHFEEIPPAVMTTTLDLDLQHAVEDIVRDTVDAFSGQGLNQAAVLVMALPSREILAWVGSADFFNLEDGQNDGATALRQPGSALKPFLYAVAFDRGVITPATLLDDRGADYRTAGGSFSPSNYSGTFHGPVSARLALASSLNLPAIKLAAEVGVEPVLEALRSSGLSSLNQEAGHYGLGLVLGGGEVDLLSLTGAYAMLGDGGVWSPPLTRLDKNREERERRVVFSPAASFIIADILRDDQARVTGFGAGSVLETPYSAAVKTGTSKNFRDNWCLGYTNGFVVGVWAGNFSADPMDRVSGVTGAGIIWRRISDLMVERRPVEEIPEPPGLEAVMTCPVSGLPAGPDCPNKRLEFFISSYIPREVCRHLEMDQEAWGVKTPVVGLKRDFGLIRPLSGEIYARDPGHALEMQQIKAQAQSVPGVDELVWILNGRELERQKVKGYERSACLLPLTAGEARLEILGLRAGEIVERGQVRYMVR
jgi:penicillin-binding protein 1C